MKILHTVEYYFPSVGGAQEVVKQLSEHLVLLGHDITVATSKLRERKQKTINGVNIEEFNISGNAVRGYLGTDIEKYRNFLINSKFDVIMNYAAQQWTADLMFEVIDKIKARKIFVPCGYSGLHDRTYKDYFSKLPNILKKYDASVYLSPNYRDINYAKEQGIRNLHVIPNGADEREFGSLDPVGASKLRKKLGINPKDKLILSIGNHTGLKGHNETINLYLKAQIPDSSLLIVGGSSGQSGCYHSCHRRATISNFLSTLAHNGKKIIITNFSREDTILAYQAADLFLFLSHVECSPLVLFESAAAGLPFISREVGNTREIAKWTGGGIICESTSCLEKLLGNDQMLHQLSLNGRSNWRTTYTWNKLAKQYLSLYKGLR